MRAGEHGLSSALARMRPSAFRGSSREASVHPEQTDPPPARDNFLSRAEKNFDQDQSAMRTTSPFVTLNGLRPCVHASGTSP